MKIPRDGTICERETGVRGIIEIIIKLKRQVVGHVAGMSDNRWTSWLTTRIFRDLTRKSGWQNIRWPNDLDKFRRYSLRDGHDRKIHWILGKVYIQQQMLKH